MIWSWDHRARTSDAWRVSIHRHGGTVSTIERLIRPAYDHQVAPAREVVRLPVDDMQIVDGQKPFEAGSVMPSSVIPAALRPKACSPLNPLRWQTPSPGGGIDAAIRVFALA